MTTLAKTEAQLVDRIEEVGAKIKRVRETTASIIFGQDRVIDLALITLLSGGEKALTAMALVFSIFKLNPAPFCMLDEVDAPLDDHNTERFCELVKSMAEQSQFVFISHNKITMELANQLLGITMQEPGVSRVVAVDIEAAMKLTEEAA